MKKFAPIVLALLFVFILSGCSNSVYETTEIQATVVQCEEGTFYPDPEYLSIAYVYFSKGEIAEWAKYNTLANDNGSYDYNVTINVEGKDYVLVRRESYEIGDTITVLQINNNNTIEYK